MKFPAIESRARISIAIFLIGLLLIIGISLTFYLQTASNVAKQRLEQTKLQAALLVSLVSTDQVLTDAKLNEYLRRYSLAAACAVYSQNGDLIARASTIEPAPEWRQLTPRSGPRGSSSAGSEHAGATGQIDVRSEGEMEIAESPAGSGRVLVVGRPSEGAPLPAIYYIFSYQLIALILGLCLLALLIRWLLRPYRRMVEAARGSPVRASSEMSESEFVVETFQALINQLQLKEKKLAALHALERRRAVRAARFS